MSKHRAAVCATVAGILMATTVAFANQSSELTLSPVIVADIGRDTDAFIRPTYSAARLISSETVEIPNPEAFYFDGATAAVAIHLDANGLVTTATVLHTTGFARIDGNVLKTVRSAKYQAATVNGRPTGGSYLVKVDLTRNGDS